MPETSPPDLLTLYPALAALPSLVARLTPMTVPPGTSSGARLRIKGRGIERADEKGDQYVVIKVVVPKKLDAEDRELVETLGKKHPVDARAEAPWK